MGLVNSANNRNVTNHLFAVEFDTILNLKFNDISGALSAGGGRHAELQKGAGKKACSCGSSERQGQPGGSMWQRQGGIISITNVISMVICQYN
uniref:Legume lectin domain-containing protein n=1 Tax=Oryza rufipogon TaxID=4529 RepID=A0A0E0R6T9_ORYRU